MWATFFFRKVLDLDLSRLIIFNVSDKNLWHYGTHLKFLDSLSTTVYLSRNVTHNHFDNQYDCCVDQVIRQVVSFLNTNSYTLVSLARYHQCVLGFFPLSL
jgi:hypothetical protein